MLLKSFTSYFLVAKIAPSEQPKSLRIALASASDIVSFTVNISDRLLIFSGSEGTGLFCSIWYYLIRILPNIFPANLPDIFIPPLIAGAIKKPPKPPCKMNLITHLYLSLHLFYMHFIRCSECRIY